MMRVERAETVALGCTFCTWIALGAMGFVGGPGDQDGRSARGTYLDFKPGRVWAAGGLSARGEAPARAAQSRTSL